MTHDELLAKLNSYQCGSAFAEMFKNAVRAVVELHKPYGEFIDGKPSFRCQANHEKYPCPTIQKIMDELK